MKWIMSGNRGLVYLRMIRTASAVLYDDNFESVFGKGHFLRTSPDDAAIIVSSSRGVYEALTASNHAAEKGIKIGVVDMPSIDPDLLLSLRDSGKLLCFAEQNNGYTWQSFLKIISRNRPSCDWTKVMALNTLDRDGKPQFLHSGTYEELADAVKLSSSHLVEAIGNRLNQAPNTGGKN